MFQAQKILIQQICKTLKYTFPLLQHKVLGKNNFIII
jgi:hypothetical protein